jgi:hypothetical protein
MMVSTLRVSAVRLPVTMSCEVSEEVVTPPMTVTSLKVGFVGKGEVPPPQMTLVQQDIFDNRD